MVSKNTNKLIIYRNWKFEVWPQEPTRAQKCEQQQTHPYLGKQKEGQERSGADDALWDGRGHVHVHPRVGLKGSPYSRSLDTPPRSSAQGALPFAQVLGTKDQRRARVKTCVDRTVEYPQWREHRTVREVIRGIGSHQNQDRLTGGRGKPSTAYQVCQVVLCPCFQQSVL